MALLTVLGSAFKVLTTVIGSAVAVGLFAIYYFQKDIIYMAKFPPESRTQVPKPSQFGFENWENVELLTKDNVKLHAYWLPYRTGKFSTDRNTSKENLVIKERYPHFDASLSVQDEYASVTLLYFHANAGNCGHRLPIAAEIQKRTRCNIFLLSYRGYGLSEGSPSESGLRADAEAALDYVYNHPILTKLGTVEKPRIVAFGQSIGGAVAIDIASRHPDCFAGIILENTFLSLPRLIPYLMPWLTPVSALCTEIWPSIDRIRSIDDKTPMLFISSGRDEMIPQAHMIKLCETVRRQRKGSALQLCSETLSSSQSDSELFPKRESNTVWVEFPNATHNDACLQRDYFDLFAEFLGSV